MARARNIKPGFFKNEVLVELPYEFRLLFIGLWTLADRDGRLEDRPKKIKMDIFPADDAQVEAGLAALATGSFIDRYDVNGNKYIQISAWHKHQTPHVKEQASTIPARCKHSASPSDSLIPDSLIPSLSTANAVEVGFEKSDGASPVNGQTEKRQAEGSHEDGDQGSKPKRTRVPYTDIVAIYHEILVPAGCPRFEVMSREREGLMRQRWMQHMPSLDQWRNYLSYVGKSKFLTGKTDPKAGQPPFVADLEWLCRPRNFAKVAEGKYHR